MKIILDAFGGDLGVQAVVDGALEAVKARSDIEIAICGDEETVKAAMTKAGVDGKFEIIHASDVVDGHDDPTRAVRTKPDSSMIKGLRTLAEGGGDAFVSSGNTGALFAGATLIVKRIPGIKRAALAPLLPAKDKPVMVLDCGANVTCTPQMLMQFGVMGSVYMKLVKHIDSPTVGLLNVGAEDTKGTDLQLEAYKLLSEAGINFIGNVEGRDLPGSVADVIVTDGFTGNIALKLYEGVAAVMMGALKEVFLSGTKSKMGAMMLKDSLGDFKKKYDYKEVGGTAFLGIRKPVFKTHGSSDAKTFCKTILNVCDYIEAGVTEEIERGIAQYNSAAAE